MISLYDNDFLREVILAVITTTRNGMKIVVNLIMPIRMLLPSPEISERIYSYETEKGWILVDINFSRQGEQDIKKLLLVLFSPGNIFSEHIIFLRYHGFTIPFIPKN